MQMQQRLAEKTQAVQKGFIILQIKSGIKICGHSDRNVLCNAPDKTRNPPLRQVIGFPGFPLNI